MSYPFRYYGTDPTDEQELIYRLELAVSPGDDLRGKIVALLPGPGGEQFEDSEAFLEAIGAEPGLVCSLWRDRWCILFQDLGDPSAHQDDVDLWLSALRKAHKLAPLREVVALTGSLDNGVPDAWSEWSLAQQQPAHGPALPFVGNSPWGDLNQ